VKSYCIAAVCVHHSSFAAWADLAAPAEIQVRPDRIEAAQGHDENEGNAIERQDIGSVRQPIAACPALP
jgi:hypothetical protein